MIKLRESTNAQKVPLGYFLDKTNGDDEETGLTISNVDILLWKMNASTLVAKNSGGATHMSHGVYYTVLDATDTNSVGALVIFVHVSGALTVRLECEVLPANVWDSRYGTDTLQVDVTQCGGSAVPAGAIPNAQAGAAGGLPTDSTGKTAFNDLSQANVRTAVGLASSNLDTQLGNIPTVAEFNARTLVAASYATAANQTTIMGYIDTEIAAILTAVGTTLNNHLLDIKGTGFAKDTHSLPQCLTATGFLDAAGVRSAVGLASPNLDTQLDNIPTVAQLNARTLVAASYATATNQTTIVTDTNELQTDWADGGRLDVLIDAIYSMATSSAAWGSINSGVVFRGTVTAADPGVSFTIGGLASQGVGAFIDANTPWYAYVFRDAGGASEAPQGEQQEVTGYTSATGLFTTDAFTVPVAVGDDVIIMSGRIAAVPEIKAKTDNLKDSWNDVSPAAVNAEVCDVLKTDTIPELGVAQPAATPTLQNAVMLLYMALRDKIDQSASVFEVHNDAGDVICKKTVSDSGSVYSEAKMVAGS